MSMLDLKTLMHSRIDELFAKTAGNSSDADCEEALRLYLMSNYSDLASLSFWLGCDANVFQDEAVPASELAGEAYFEIHREAEFNRPSRREPYSALNHRQQFGAVIEGARL